MYITGLNYTSHNAAATIVGPQGIIAAAEEERFDRKKHSSYFPQGALEYCLDAAGIGIEELEAVSFFVKPDLFFRLYTPLQGFPKSLGLLPYVIKQIRDSSTARLDFDRFVGDRKMPHFNYVEHHLAHAASCYFLSPYDNAAILTLDGRGEHETLCIYQGQGKNIKKLHTVSFPHSIGILYETVTRYLGFFPRDEYKVMGLASYGTSRLEEEWNTLVKKNKNGDFMLNLSYFDHYYRYGKHARGFSKLMEKTFGQARNPKDPITEKHADIAHAVQSLVEKVILFYAQKAYDLTGAENLCVAGGVALNCVANQKIEQNMFKNVFIQPAANDAGTSLGAALYTFFDRHAEKERKNLENVYWGPEFSDSQIFQYISTDNRIKYEYVENPGLVAARLIHQNAIIGWFQGRMEFGPRALGNRSILASATKAENKDIINEKIKYREEFRPFAPAVLAEFSQNYFDVSPAGAQVYPYMLATTNVKSGMQEIIPAVVHVDGTARIQVVRKEMNPLYWNLIKEYSKLSGIPVILNTSFNVKGEPIVCSPKDAIATFLNSGIDFVVMGNYLISRKEKNN